MKDSVNLLKISNTAFVITCNSVNIDRQCTNTQKVVTHMNNESQAIIINERTTSKWDTREAEGANKYIRLGFKMYSKATSTPPQTSLGDTKCNLAQNKCNMEQQFNVSPRSDWQNMISQSACIDETHCSFNCQSACMDETHCSFNYQFYLRV